jgi:hypothetical protein
MVAEEEDGCWATNCGTAICHHASGTCYGWGPTMNTAGWLVHGRWQQVRIKARGYRMFVPNKYALLFLARTRIVERVVLT